LIKTRAILHAAEIPVQESQLGQAEDFIVPILEFLSQPYGIFKLPCGQLKIPSLDLDFAIGDSLFINLSKISVFRATSEKKNRKKKQAESDIKNSKAFVEGNSPSLLVK
jgi:hypothetical protein